jgi:hypothetical protein
VRPRTNPLVWLPKVVVSAVHCRRNRIPEYGCGRIWRRSCWPGTFGMPHNLPVAASGSREPDKRPKPIPRAVRTACLLMIYGNPDGNPDDDAAPIDFIAAAKLVGIRPHQFRRWLHTPQVIGLIRRERAAFRQAICCGNELALKRVRDTSKNPMGVVAAVRGLDQINDDPHSRGVEPISPRITINIIPPPASLPSPPMKTIQHESQPEPELIERYDANGYRIDGQGNRCFSDPTRPR